MLAPHVPRVLTRRARSRLRPLWTARASPRARRRRRRRALSQMTTFNSGVLWQAPVQVFAKLNLTVLETLSFPYSSRLEGKAGVRGGHYRADGKFGQVCGSRPRPPVGMSGIECAHALEWRPPGRRANPDGTACMPHLTAHGRASADQVAPVHASSSATCLALTERS